MSKDRKAMLSLSQCVLCLSAAVANLNALTKVYSELHQLGEQDELQPFKKMSAEIDEKLTETMKYFHEFVGEIGNE